MLLHSIPDELIINADQAPPKSVATDNITIAAKGQKHILKRSIIFQFVNYFMAKPYVPNNLQRKDITMVFVYPIMKKIGVMRWRPSVLLSRSLCYKLKSLKKKKVYQTIKKVSL